MEQSPKLTRQEKRLLRREQRQDEHDRFHRQGIVKRILLWSVIMLGLGLLIYAMIVGVARPPQNLTLNTEVSENDWIKGNPQAPATLVEYSDFQCSACALYHPILKQLTEEWSDKIRFVYRHFPLQQHQNAELAAIAAEAAGQQGKFWEMHDLIFQNQTGWANLTDKAARENFQSYAQQLNIDLLKFENDIDNKLLKEKVNNDYSSGLASGVNATPTFFLNGKKILNPRNYEDFKNLILSN